MNDCKLRDEQNGRKLYLVHRILQSHPAYTIIQMLMIIELRTNFSTYYIQELAKANNLTWYANRLIKYVHDLMMCKLLSQRISQHIKGHTGACIYICYIKCAGGMIKYILFLVEAYNCSPQYLMIQVHSVFCSICNC